MPGLRELLCTRVRIGTSASSRFYVTWYLLVAFYRLLHVTSHVSLDKMMALQLLLKYLLLWLLLSRLGYVGISHVF